MRDLRARRKLPITAVIVLTTQTLSVDCLKEIANHRLRTNCTSYLKLHKVSTVKLLVSMVASIGAGTTIEASTKYDVWNTLEYSSSMDWEQMQTSTKSCPITSKKPKIVQWVASKSRMKMWRASQTAYWIPQKRLSCPKATKYHLQKLLGSTLCCWKSE